MKSITKLFKRISTIKTPKQPSRAVIETTNHCNLNCPFCLVGMQNELTGKNGNVAHDLMTRPRGFMDDVTFNQVMRELKLFGIKKTYLHFQGEPFLNKLTPKYASELKRQKFEVAIFTNGQTFNEKSILELADAEVDLLRFSVDGASEETYQKNRVGGKFVTVLENMKKVVAAHKNKKTCIEWQFIALRNNEHEIEKARELAKEIGVHFFVKGFRETDSKLAPANPHYRAQFHRKPCTDIYHQLGIYWNGDIVPCCYDVDGKEIMGNLLEQDLKTIWHNEKYINFRKNVAKSKMNSHIEPDICKSCLRWK